MVARSTLIAFALLLCACTPTPPPALPQAEVQEFVNAYVAAFNAGDDSKLMGLIRHDAAVSSIGVPRRGRRDAAGIRFGARGRAHDCDAEGFPRDGAGQGNMI
jgi:hypothetical protein